MARTLALLAVLLMGCTSSDPASTIARAAEASCRQQTGCMPGSGPGVAPMGVAR